MNLEILLGIHYNPLAMKQKNQKAPKDITLEMLEMWLDTFVWTGVLTTIVVLTGFAIWWSFGKTHTKHFAGVNYFREAIKIQIGTEQFDLAPFEFFEYTTDSDTEVIISVSDSSGNPIDSRVHITSNLPGAGIDIFKPTTSNAICPAVIDVTELYYPVLGKQNRDIYLLSKLSEFQANGSYYEYQIIDEFVATLNLGQYNGEILPDMLTDKQRVRGIYLIECQNLNDQEKLYQDVLWWTNYDPADQQQLFQEQIEEARNTPEYRL